MNERISRRSLLKVAGIGAAGAALAACAATPAPEVVKETVVVEKEVEPAAITEPVEVVFHGRMGKQGDWFQKYADMFNESQSGIRAVCENIPGSEFHQKIQISAVGGTIGDAIWETSAVHFYSFAARGLFADHTPLVEVDNYDMGQFFKYSVEEPGGVTVEGKIRGLPWLCNPGASGLFYNKGIFDQAGTGYPEEGWTYDDLTEAALSLAEYDAEGNPTRFGFYSSIECYHVCDQWRAWGSDWISRDGKTATIDSEGCVGALQWVSDMVNEHRVSPSPAQVEGGIAQMFGSGKLAMFAEYYGSVSYGDELYSEIDWAVAPTPFGPSGIQGHTLFFDPVSVTAQSKHPHETFQFLRSMVTREAGIDLALAQGYPGCRPDVWASEELTSKPYHDVFAKSLEDSIPVAVPANFRLWELYLECLSGLDPLATGTEPDATKVAAALNPKLQAILDRPII